MKVDQNQINKWKEKGMKIVQRKRGIIINPEYQKEKIIEALANRPRKSKKPNKTESTYALQLEVLKKADLIIHYGWEEVTLKLADGTRYTPDFFVVTYNGQPVTHVKLPRIEFIEVKGGHIWEDSKIKFKVARKMFPWFKFKMMQYKDKQWTELYPE